MVHHVRSHHSAFDFMNSGLPAPDIRKGNVSAFLSMCSKNKHLDIVQQGQISGRTSQQNFGTQEAKENPQIERVSPPVKIPAGSTTELLPILPHEFYVDRDGNILQEAQNVSQVRTIQPCDQNFNFDTKLLPSFPGSSFENIRTDFVEHEEPALEFIDGILSMENADSSADAELLALVDTDEILRNDFDECDMYFAPAPDNATDAEMQFLANNPTYLDPPFLSMEPDAQQIHPLFDF